MDKIYVHKIEGRTFLGVKGQEAEIDDYKVINYGDGNTEIRLMGAGRFWITDDCKSLQTAFSDAVWNKDVTDKDERLDDGSTDIDSLDAFEYTIERDMKDLIEEVEDV